MTRAKGILLTLVVIAIGAAVAVVVWNWDTIVEKIARKAVLAERREWMKRTQELESILGQMRREEPAAPLPTERLRQVFGPDTPLLQGLSPKNMRCRQLEEALRAFCGYLDVSETMRSHELEQGSWSFFSDTLTILEQRPPVISGESYRPLTIIENSFYFFRLLRTKKINVIRDIMKYEADLAEPLMGVLYYWLMSGRQCDTPGPSPQTLKVMYEYAGFFLNTLGGRSYLSRRDSRTRLLAIYYGILVIHESNLRGLNEVGLDLRFFLPLVFNEIQSRNDLLHHEEYLQTLSDLQLHYFRL